MSDVLQIHMQKHGPFFSELPLDEVLDYFQHCMQRNPQLMGEYKSIVMRIEHLKKQFAAQIKIQASEADRIERMHLQQLTCHIVANKKGLLFCPACNKPHSASNIIYETYKRELTTGKRFYCRQNHLMLDMIDLRLTHH